MDGAYKIDVRVVLFTDDNPIGVANKWGVLATLTDPEGVKREETYFGPFDTEAEANKNHEEIFQEIQQTQKARGHLTMEVQ